MAIYRMLRNERIGVEEASILAAAYELTLRALDIKDRADPVTERVAENDNRDRAAWLARSTANFRTHNQGARCVTVSVHSDGSSSCGKGAQCQRAN